MWRVCDNASFRTEGFTSKSALIKPEGRTVMTGKT